MLESDRTLTAGAVLRRDQLIHFLDRAGDGFLAIDVQPRLHRSDAHRHMLMDADGDGEDIGGTGGPRS